MSALFPYLLQLGLALGGEIEVQSKVAEVTVYTDRARIVREVTVDVPAGRSDLVFDGLSIQLIEDSLSAEGEGTAGAVITGLDIRTKRGTEDRDARVRELEKERRALEAKVAVQLDLVARADGELAFLHGLKPTAPTQLREDLFLADDAPAQLATLSRQMGEDMRALQAEKRTASFAVRDLQAEIQRIDRELSQLRAPQNQDHQRVAVGLDAARPGKVTVRLSYVATGAGWTPRYASRYRLEDGKVRLDLAGDVSQRTGEDWTGVGLTLSTARPERGTQPPELSPFVLGESYGGGQRAAGGDRVTAVEYKARRTEDVPSDGTTRRVPLTSFELPSTVVHQVVPRRAEQAYLTARVVWSGETALLPGPVAAYLGSAFVGEGRLGLVAPGGEVDLSFGVDDRVSVKRKRLDTTETGAKPLGKTERARYAWETQVENRTGKPIQLVVVEQVPASREAAFTVETTTEPATAIPTEGVFKWEATVANGAKQSFVVRYEVTWPEGQRPQLLD